MSKRVTNTIAPVILSMAIMLSGLGIGVSDVSTPVKASAKTGKVYLNKKKMTLYITQNKNKITASSAKLKVKKKKGVKIKKVTYSSDGVYVANVNKSGKVKAMSTGDAIITVKVKYKYKKKTTTKKLTCKVNVANKYKNIFTDLRFKQAKYTTFVGNSEGICPCYKSDAKLDNEFYAWDCLKMEVADKTIVKPGINGYIMGLKPGSTTITIKSTDGTNLSVSTTVKVYESAEAMPPQEDLYESEKDEFLSLLEGSWTEEEKTRFIDEDGHIKWSYTTQAQLVYDNNLSKLYDDYRAGKVDSHPDGSAQDSFLSLISTQEAMLHGKTSDEMFFEVLKKKIVEPIMKTGSLSELMKVCSDLNYDGIKALYDTSEFNQEQDNYDRYMEVYRGDSRATAEDESVEYHYYFNFDPDIFYDLPLLNTADKNIKKYIKSALGYMGITDKNLISDTYSLVIDNMNYSKKKISYNDFVKLDTLDKKYPNLKINEFIGNLHYDLDKNNTISIGGERILKKLNDAFRSEDNLPALKGYAILTAIKNMLPYTKSGLRASIELFEDYLIEGKNEKQIKDVIDSQLSENVMDTSKLIPWDIDQVYTDTYYSKNFKKEFEQLAERYRSAYIKAINECDMSNTAKSAMGKKIKNMKLFCLYPTADEYDKLTVQDDMKTAEEGACLADSLLSIFAYKQHLSRISVEHKAAELNWWAPGNTLDDGLVPWDNNAFYTPHMNVCTLCHANIASIFEENPEKSVEKDIKNIAYMATTIGHEIGHGFDGYGCNFNDIGHLQNIWEKSDWERFDDKLNKMAELYGTYMEFSSDKDKIAIYQNGKNVTNEAVSDLGGTEIGLRVLKDTYPNNDDYIRDYFIHSARQWLSTENDYESADELWSMRDDVHPQVRARTNGVASCMDEFYRVFDVKDTDAMYIAPEDRVVMWPKAS